MRMDKSYLHRFWIVFLLGVSVVGLADEKEKHQPNSHSTRQAPVEASEEGIQLSDAVVKTLGIGLGNLSGSSPFSVPTRALIFHQDEVGIYRYRKGRFKLVDIEILNKAGVETTIQTSELMAGDQIVVTGAALLRITDLQASGGAGDLD